MVAVAAACTSMYLLTADRWGAAFLALKEKLSPGHGQALLLLSLPAMGTY